MFLKQTLYACNVYFIPVARSPDVVEVVVLVVVEVVVVVTHVQIVFSYVYCIYNDVIRNF